MSKGIRRSESPPEPAATPPPLTASGRNWTTLALVAALVVLTLAAYAPVRGFGLVSYDDPIYVTDNPYLRNGLSWPAIAAVFTTTYANFWHPLTLLSLMVDVSLFGMRAGPIHLTSLLLHLASTVVLFFALRRMTGAPGRSAFVAALFAVHPLHVESVAWISERKDVLSTLFWMLTLWAWAEYARSNRRRIYALALVLFALGLMAKPMLVSLPLTLLLLDFWPLGRVRADGTRRSDDASGGWRSVLATWWPLVREKIPFFALAAAAAVVAFVAQQQGGAVAGLQSLPLSSRAVTALVACLTYIVKMFWPSGLVPYYPPPPTIAVWPAVGAALIIGGVSYAAWRLRRQRPYLAVGWSWYLVTLLPVSGLVQVGSHALADRYTYVPLLGLFVIVAWGVPPLVGSRRFAQAALAAVEAALVLACVVTTRHQVETWKDSTTLWRHALQMTPDNYYAHNALGLVLSDRSPAEAAEHFAAAARLLPIYPNPPNNLGLLLARQGRTSEAIAQYEEALRRSPDFGLARINLGNALLKVGRSGEAVDHFRAAVRVNPKSAAAHVGLGNGLVAIGQVPEALQEFEEALRIDPASGEARYNLGNALQRLGRPDAALEQYRQAIGHGADSADLRNNMAATLVRMGRPDEAMAQLREALRLAPGSFVARTNLGNALLAAGHPAEAIEEYREAVRLSPDYAEARTNLGNALVDLGRPEEALVEQARAVLSDPRSPDAHFSLAGTLLRLGRTEAAITEFQRALALGDATADVHIGLGTALARLGRLDEAAAHFREAVRLDPGSAEAAAGLERVMTASAARRR